MKIMVCYDGTDVGKIALNVTSQHAEAHNAEILVVTALEGEPHEQLHNIEKAEQALQSAKTILTTGGRVCETKLLLNESNKSAGGQLIECARKQKVDMIVIGLKKRSKVGKMLTGSNAQHVILEADCPVLAVK